MKRHFFKSTLAILPFLLLFVAAAGGVSAAIRNRLNITSSQTEDYARLIFHRTTKGEFQPKIDGNKLIVRFDSPFWSNLSDISKKLSGKIQSADISKDGKTLTFILSHPESVYLRPFIGESFVGLDLVKREAPKSEPKAKSFAGGTLVYEEASIQQGVVTEPFELAQQDLQKIALDSALSASEQDESNTPAKTSEVSTSQEGTQVAQTEDAANQESLQENTTTAPKKNEATIAENETAVESSQATVQAENPVDVTVATGENSTSVPQSTPIANDDTTEQTGNSAETVATTEEAAQQEAVASEEIPADENTISQEVQEEEAPEEDSVTLSEQSSPPPSYTEVSFGWSKPVAATIFTRGKYAWFIFNNHKPINIAGFVNKYSQLFESGEQLKNRQYTILRFKMRYPFSLASFKKEMDWYTAFTTRRNPPTQPFPVSQKASSLHGNSLEIESTQFAEPIRMTDPLVGDELLIIPSYEAEAGIGSTKKQVDFTLLQSAQGVAIQLKSDNVQIEQNKFGISLSGPTNRITSAESQALREKMEELKRKREEARQAKLAEEGEQALLKFHTWMGEKHFSEERQRLEEEIMSANWENKNPFRLELAQFYLANGMEVEALGVIKTLRSYDEAYGNRTDVLMVEGAANYLAGRYQDALTAFEKIDVTSMPELKVEEVTFWKAASELKLGTLIRMDKFITRHPLKDSEKQNEQTEDKSEITKLILDTSSRLLKMIKKIDPELATSEEIQTLESTARFVSSHYQDAIKRFGETETYRTGDVFEAEDETLWWNTSGIRGQVTQHELKYLDNRLLFLKDYPTTIYNDFGLLALEERLENNDIGTAERILETFRDSTDTAFQNNLTYLRGLFYAKDEEIDLALETWEPLTKDVFDRFNRARSTFATTGILLRTGRINLDQAIDAFNSIRVVWRGDVLELNLLKLLGEFYMDRKQYMQAFTTWRQVLTTFPGSEDALLIAKKMNQEFVYLFNSGGANQLSQLEALTLYYEFRELTPVGKQGDQMILKLVERLVEVDLLDRATALLTHLVRFRLTGEEKHIASTRLAEIYLMANEYEKALDALTATKSDRIDEELSTRRRYIQAKALIHLKQNNQALALLRNDETLQASFLRADIYWRNKVWRKVIDELEYPFKEIIREERNLTNEESEALNKIAISYALTGNKKRLRILQEDFTPFVKPKQQQLLAFISNEDNVVDYRNLEASLGLEKMEKFIDSYMSMAGSETRSDSKAQ